MISRWRNNWRKFKALSPVEKGTLFSACLVMPLVALCLRFTGLKRTMAILAASHREMLRRPKSGARNFIRSAARLVEIAARLIPGKPACLTRSVTLWHLLARKGINSELKIGVQKEPGIFSAHAWVEADGLVLLDQGDVKHRYHVIV